jgi:predicted secreted protein
MNLNSIRRRLAGIFTMRSKFVFEDHRSLRIIAVIDCILNQNSRDFGAANYPAMNKAVLQLCMKYNAGILPIPCPEMAFLGLQRNRPKGKSIKDALNTEAGRKCCREISRLLADKIEDYIKNGSRLLAVLGGNTESPGCAVLLQTSEKNRRSLSIQSGVFMREFHAELLRRKIEVPFRGIRDCHAEWIKEDLEWLETTLSKNMQ